MGDPIRLYRVLLELIVNALKFTETGYVKAVARVTQEKGNDLILEITVEDTGIGIPADRHPELFTRFSRFSPSYPELCKGAGIGLFITKQFIQDMQGEIHYDTHYLAGTRFVCAIPVRRALSFSAIGADETHFRARAASIKLDKPIESYHDLQPV